MKISYLKAAVFVAALQGTVVMAQTMPSYEETGVLTAVIDGKTTQFHTTTNTVPGQPGRLVHTASWRIMEPMKMGGVSFGPDGIFVSLVGHTSVPLKAADASLKITFLIDKTTHKLDTTTPFEVVYVSDKASGAIDYRHKDGQLEIVSVVPGDGDTLNISGHATGRLTNESSSGTPARDADQDYQIEFQVRAHALPR